MLSSLLKVLPFSQKNIIDESTRNWLFDTYAWALTNFDFDEFKHQSQLVLPNNQFYPGTVSSVEQMAQTIFEQTKHYAGMKNWPIELVSPEEAQPLVVPKLNVKGNNRGDKAILPELSSVAFIEPAMTISYQPSQVNQPQDLIAGQVQALATILIMQQDSLPPGGKDFLPQAVDLVACFMGFGVMFANTAYQFKGGCGSCKSANRQATLPENETVYALAIFCLLKSIPAKTVKKQLKSHLRALFVDCYKELAATIKTSSNPTLLALL